MLKRIALSLSLLAPVGYSQTVNGRANQNVSANLIQGKPVASTAPTTNQVFQFNATSGQWEPTNGNFSASQLIDFSPTLSAGTITENASNSSAAPSIVAATPYYRGITSISHTITSGAASETEYDYIDASGVRTVGTSTIVISCTSCTAVTGITAFPAGSTPLYTWTITSGAYATSGGYTDWRAFLGGGSGGGSFNGGTITGSLVVSLSGGGLGVDVTAASGNIGSRIQSTQAAFPNVVYQEFKTPTQDFQLFLGGTGSGGAFANNMVMYDATNSRAVQTWGSNGIVTFSGPVGVSSVQLSVGSLSALGTCTSGSEGATGSINDSTVNTWGTTVTGGGTNHVLVYCDGTNWTVAAK